MPGCGLGQLRVWKPNARRQARPDSGSEGERTLLAVGCNIPYPHGQSPPQKQGRTTTLL